MMTPMIVCFSTTPGYVYEENLEDFLDVIVQISGFPTYVLFQNGQEKARATNLAELEKMMQDHAATAASTSTE